MLEIASNGRLGQKWPTPKKNSCDRCEREDEEEELDMLPANIFDKSYKRIKYVDSLSRQS